MLDGTSIRPRVVIPTGSTTVSMSSAGIRSRDGVSGPLAWCSVTARTPISGLTVEIGFPNRCPSASWVGVTGPAACRPPEGAGNIAPAAVRVADATIPRAIIVRWDWRRTTSSPSRPASAAPRKRPPPQPAPAAGGGAFPWGAIPPLGGPGSPGAGCPVIDALEESLLVLGSVSISADFEAVFVIRPVAVTVAVTVRVVVAPLASEPMFQTPLPAVYVPLAGVADTNVSPDGRRSVTCTPVASVGPRLWAVMVKVTLEPTSTLPLLASLATLISASDVTAVGSEEELFATLMSLPPATVAVF